MFGGYSDIHTLAPRSDTWQFTKDRGWYNATAVIAPEARSEHALATTGVGAVLFGGTDKADTWIYISDHWQKMNGCNDGHCTEMPPPRSAHAMSAIGQNAEGGVLLFGGLSRNLDSSQNIPNEGAFADTWLFDTFQTTWRNMTRALPTPSHRFAHAMAPFGSDAVVLFGGWGRHEQVNLADTWIYRNTDQWVNITLEQDKDGSSTISPPGRCGHAMAPLGPNGTLRSSLNPCFILGICTHVHYQH